MPAVEPVNARHLRFVVSQISEARPGAPRFVLDLELVDASVLDSCSATHAAMKLRHGWAPNFVPWTELGSEFTDTGHCVLIKEWCELQLQIAN